VYFAFLFADRVAAGSAIPWASGLSFGIDSQYKKGMDVALFIFLVLAAVVEYMVDHFMRYWSRLAEQENDSARVCGLLTRRYMQLLTVICVLFALLASGLWFAYSRSETKVLVTAILGSVGYFYVALALFNSIVLFSVSQADRALRLVSFALICNALTGYILSHLIGVQFAAIGLLVGGLVLFVTSYRTVYIVLLQPAYFYALA
jgi:O-antigen/teichoic acid export membrane protein